MRCVLIVAALLAAGAARAGTPVTDEAGFKTQFEDGAVSEILFGDNITLTGDLTRANTGDPLSIVGTGYTLDVGGKHITVGGTLAGIANLTVTGGEAQSSTDDTFGGAMYVGRSFTGVIGSGTVFRNNSATSANGKAFGGAIFVNTETPSAASDMTLSAKAGQTTLFQGNTAGGKASSIHFGRVTAGDASAADVTLRVVAGAGGTVALHDPLSVDMNYKTFTMSVSGGGDFLWGGTNRLAVSNDGRSSVAFGDARTTLLGDFQLTNKNDVFYVDDNSNYGQLDVTFDTSNRFSLDLTGRPDEDDLPYFTKNNNLADYTIVSGTAAIDEVYALTFDAVNARYLLADSTDVAGIDASTFAVSTASPLFSARLENNGNKYYVVFNNDGVIAAMAGNANDNVVDAYAAGQFSDAWDPYYADDEVAYMTKKAVFHEMAANPERYIGEAGVSLIGSSLRLQTAGVDSALALNQASWEWWEEWEGQASAASGLGLASLRRSLRQPLRFWGGYFGGRDRQTGDDGYYGYKTRYHGAGVGASYDFSAAVTAGVYFNHAIGISRANSLRSEIKSNANNAGVFVSLRPSRRWTVDLDAAFGWYDNDLRRDNASGVYRDAFDQTAFTVGGKAAYRADLGGFAVSPFLGVRYQHLRQDSLREKGGAFAYRLSSADADSFATRLGVEVAKRYSFACGRSLLPVLRAAWRHEFGDRQYSASGGFVNSAHSYRVNSVEHGRDTLELGLGVRAVLVQTDRYRLEAEASYDLDLRDNFVGQHWYAGLGLRF